MKDRGDVAHVANSRRTVLERLLGLFADVRAGEGPSTLLLTLNVFLLLTCYYLLKAAREPLILASGAEVKSYSSAGQALLLIPGTYVYGRIAERVGRMRLIATVTLFFAANLVLFFVAGKAHVPHLGIAFFLWVGVFNMMIVAQFWSFAADIYGSEQGKRLFAILGIGSTVGSVVGSAIARALFETIGAYGLILTSAGLLLAALAVTARVNAREQRNKARQGVEPKNEPLGQGGGFAMLLKDRYLLLLGGLSFVLNWVNSSGEYILDRSLLEAAKLGVPSGIDAAAWTDTFIGEYKANYFLWVNAASVVLQLFVVSRVIKYLGVRFALILVPVLSLTGYSTLTFYPALGIILAVKVAENTLDYSLQNTSRQALWLITSREAKYKAKSVIDTFVVRAGDVLSASVTAVGAMMHLATIHFIAINVVLVLCWLTVVVFLTRQYRTKSQSAELSVAPLRVAPA